MSEFDDEVSEALTAMRDNIPPEDIEKLKASSRDVVVFLMHLVSNIYEMIPLHRQALKVGAGLTALLELLGEDESE